jgi:hypothetical protein
MPKISTNRLCIYNTKQSHTEFVIDVFYNNDLKFYATIPDAFNENFDLLSFTEMQGFNAGKHYRSQTDRVSNPNNFKRIVSDTTENGVIKNIEKFLSYLIEFTIVSRDVIVLFFNTNETRYNNMSFEKTKHPQRQMVLGITYCTETRIPNLGKPKYMQYKEYTTASGNLIKEKSEFHIFNDKCTVLDDTPENRIFLENIYVGFDNLIKAMEEFTKTPETLLALIQSGQKLLS